ncbi:CLUMA_CG020068, isoform A [Clunio marinus]|uniref:CLUMA_CG020068, isoform A n=1 Tax=Clunio marinus TaxID=568069 RepID=A0A1J1J3L5_9DIPT|nr:CLUMA_CG020068, isoform A [Clunio marinus]
MLTTRLFYFIYLPLASTIFPNDPEDAGERLRNETEATCHVMTLVKSHASLSIKISFHYNLTTFPHKKLFGTGNFDRKLMN